MGAWVIFGTIVLAYYTIPGNTHEVEDSSAGELVTVTTKPIHFGQVYDDSIGLSDEAEVVSSQTPFRASKQLYNDVLLQPNVPESARKFGQLYEDLNTIGAIPNIQLQFKPQEHLFSNLLVLPPQPLTYNIEQNPSNEEDVSKTEELSDEDQGVSESISYDTANVYPEHTISIPDYSKNKQKEIHYHQHKHLHEHDHKQEHIHKHRQEHLHDHHHGHKHDEHNTHQHQAHHQHHHKDENYHSHKGSHHHEHESSHHHDHKQENKHEHWHDQKHHHHSDHKHSHYHKGEHLHEHHSQHKHEQKHAHDHYGKHKHHHNGHHQHSHHHKHSGHHHHNHHSDHEHHHQKHKPHYRVHIKKYHHH